VELEDSGGTRTKSLVTKDYIPSIQVNPSLIRGVYATILVNI
jgi:hypothetical protein